MLRTNYKKGDHYLHCNQVKKTTLVSHKNVDIKCSAHYI